MTWLPKNSVVVPVDFSDNSSDAIKTALELVDDPTSVHAIHVLLPLEVASPGVVWGAYDDDTRINKASQHFEEFLSTHGFAAINTSVIVGDPGLKIIGHAKEVDAELIVIPSHGYHGIKRLLLGSVAERVIRHAECPVLVLRRADAE